MRLLSNRDMSCVSNKGCVLWRLHWKTNCVTVVQLGCPIANAAKKRVLPFPSNNGWILLGPTFPGIIGKKLLLLKTIWGNTDGKTESEEYRLQLS